VRDAALWQTRLKPGEKLVWTGIESETALKASQPDRRLMRLGFGVVSGALAIALAFRFIESGAAYLRSPNLEGAIGAPLYLAATITLGLISVFSFLRINEPPPPPRRYALSSDRLLIMNHKDAVTGEFPRSDIRKVDVADSIAETFYVTVTGPPRDEDAPRTFTFSSIEDASLKAVLETEFPEALQ
jgi:hypothetical protein